jgi:hypothetical protein
MELNEDLTSDVDLHPTGNFQIAEKVLVFDENMFDIHQGTVKEIGNDEVFIHYPRWPRDDNWIPKRRILPVTDKNLAVFNAQERIRRGMSTDDEEERAPRSQSKARIYQESETQTDKSQLEEGESVVSTYGLSKEFVLSFDAQGRRINPNITLSQLAILIKEIGEMTKEHPEKLK